MADPSVARAALGVVREHPRLAVFPALSFVVSALAFPAAIWTLTVGVGLLAGQLGAVGVPLVVALPLSVFLGVAVVVGALAALVAFCNVALSHATDAVRRGEAVSVRRGLAAATRAVPTVLAYGALAGTAGPVFGVLERATGGAHVGGAFAAMAGSPYTALTYLVGPLAATENPGPKATFDRSVELLDGRFGPGHFASLSAFEDPALLGALPLVTVHLGTLLDGLLGPGAFAALVVGNAVVVNAVLLAVLWLGVVAGAALGAVAKTALYAALVEDLSVLPLLDLPVETAVDVSAAASTEE